MHLYSECASDWGWRHTGGHANNQIVEAHTGGHANDQTVEAHTGIHANIQSECATDCTYGEAHTGGMHLHVYMYTLNVQQTAGGYTRSHASIL